MNKVVAPLTIARGLPELWSPRVIAELDDSYVKVGPGHARVAHA